jgi:nitroreductase
MQSMELRAALRTTGAVRSFEPDGIPEALVARILDSARFAPSGGNRQPWRVVVVQDAETRRSLRASYQAGWAEYLALGGAGLVPFAPVTDHEREAATIAAAAAAAPTGEPDPIAEAITAAPLVVVVFADLRRIAAVDKGFDRYTFAGGASIYPFAWSIVLAAREEGLGGVITTMPIRREGEVQALLGSPPELALAALIALGRPQHQPTRLRRHAVEEFATIDRIDGAPLRG